LKHPLGEYPIPPAFFLRDRIESTIASLSHSKAGSIIIFGRNDFPVTRRGLESFFGIFFSKDQISHKSLQRKRPGLAVGRRWGNYPPKAHVRKYVDITRLS
jgi:hypothetical protein